MELKQALRISAVGLGLLAGAARADLVLEYDFRNPTFGGGAGTTASYTANGGSPDADLVGGNTNSLRPNLGATYTLPTGLNTGYDTRLQTGYLSLTPVSGPDQALGTANKLSGTDHLMSTYMGDSTFSSGSMVIFFKPNASGVPNLRETFFWTGTNNSSNNLLWLMNDDDQHGPTLRRNDSDGAGPATGILASIDNYSYDSNTWYMLAASWKANDVDGAGNVLYIRALTEDSVATYVETNTELVDGNALINTGSSEIFLGRRRDNSGDGANANFALFQLYNNSATVAQMDAYYLAMTPEPGSLSVIVMCAGFLLRRRRA